MKYFLLVVISISLCIVAFSQPKSISIQGQIVDENNFYIPHVDISNRRQQLAFSSDKFGKFSTTMLSTDSLFFFKTGFLPHKVKIIDSTLTNNTLFLNVIIVRIPVELTEVQITALKTHQQIRKSINNLYIPNTDLHPDAKPLQNPISYLYELISKKEKEKRLAANLETEYSKRSILKDLFNLYNIYNIIDLPEDDYENFITYLNMPYEFMQRVSDYDLAITIKYKFIAYRNDKANWIRKEIYPPAIDDLERIRSGQNKN